MIGTWNNYRIYSNWANLSNRGTPQFLVRNKYDIFSNLIFIDSYILSCTNSISFMTEM